MATAPKSAGIMDLPENEDMNQGPQLSLMESYDAVSQGLKNASPQASAEYEQTMATSLPPELLEMSVEEIGQLLQIFQYLQDNPEEYPTAIAELIKDGIIDEGDLPAEYDPEVLATIGALLLQAMKSKQGAMTQAPQGFAMGGIADAARAVAAQGRGQDTMLAHITPEEAQLLRSRGGMGTINPVTGLREYGFLSKLNPFKAVKSVVKAVKKVVKSVVNVAKKIVSSPLGKIVATVALATFLGPAGAGLITNAAVATGVASGAVTLAGGGNLKDALISGATAYFGAPQGPVASYVGSMGITNTALRAATQAGLTGVGAGLLQGKSLKDSIKNGLVQGAIGGGVQAASEFMAGRSPFDSLTKGPAETPATAPAESPVGRVLTPEDVARGQAAEVNPYDVGGGFAGTAPPAPSTNPFTRLGEEMAGPNPYEVGGGFAGTAPPAAAATAPMASAGTVPSAPVGGGRMIPNMTPQAEAAMAMTPRSTGSGGIGDLLASAKDYGTKAYEGAKDLYNQYLSPSEIAKRGIPDAVKAANDAVAQLGSNAPQSLKDSVYKSAYESAMPGVISQYAPMVAAGLGATALMGGFKQPETPPSELQQKLSGTPGEDLIEADPSKYIIGGLPGVEYDERGNIIGSKPWSPGQTLADIRVPSPGTAPGQNLMNAYAPPTYSPTAGGGRSILQPYNTSSMYSNLMGTPIQPRYAAQGGMMGGGIASLAGGGYPRRTGQISGPGTEKSDSIPAMLSDGEFVMTAKAVRGAGNGSRRAGAKKMYALMHQLEKNAARG